MSELISLPVTAAASEFGGTVTLLCAWNERTHLIGAIVHALEHAFTFTTSDTRSIEDTQKKTASKSNGNEINNEESGQNGRKKRTKGRQAQKQQSATDTKQQNSDATIENTAVLSGSVALNILNFIMSAGMCFY